MSDATVRDLEGEIERTRERMSRNLDELGDRLSPEHITQRARAQLRARIDELRQRALGLVRAYPEQAVAIGLGILVAILAPRRSSASRGAPQRPPRHH